MVIVLEGSKSRLIVEQIDVGHGDATLLHWVPESGEPSTILIDGGPKTGALRIAETLAGLGVNRIDLAVLSHCDADHIDGMLAYAEGVGRGTIETYWGPCLPAFERHEWLFPERIKRGLRQTSALQDAIGLHRTHWPVEGATWISQDGGLRITTLSPPGRLIERLLLASDSAEIFAHSPTNLGWLLAGAGDDVLDDEDDRYAEVRDAIRVGLIRPSHIPSILPRHSIIAQELIKQASIQFPEPEFFGNSVLNDTSIVLLVEARVGHIQRRLLFTGDLENFTYLLARWPSGLNCEVVKAPHHGSYSYVGRDVAYDAVWQWLRPRVVMVSANGKHNLPRSDFRDAALRYGATVFCTSRRSKEIVSGHTSEPCCHVQYGCAKIGQAPVSLSITDSTIESEGVACARGNISGVMPVIEVRQHVVVPSPILSSITENELRRHTEWLIGWLRKLLVERLARPSSSELEPIAVQTIRKAALAAGHLNAVVEIEKVLECAAREGKIWLSQSRRARSEEQKAWIMPSRDDQNLIKKWIDRIHTIQLGVSAKAASAIEELMYSADTSWIADRFAKDMRFPKAMFEDVIWPIMASHLLNTRLTGVKVISDDASNMGKLRIIIVLSKGKTLTKAIGNLSAKIKKLSIEEEIERFIRLSSIAHYNDIDYQYKWPEQLNEVVSPVWLSKLHPVSGLANYRDKLFKLGGDFSPGNLEKVDEWLRSVRFNFKTQESIDARLIPEVLAALIFGGIEVISAPTPSPSQKNSLD